MKPPFGRMGGKSLSYKKIIQYFPKHYNTYIEPFVGAGSVFFNKPNNDSINVLNDLDENIYKVFCLLREKDINDEINRNITENYFNTIKHSQEPIHVLERYKTSYYCKGNHYTKKNIKVNFKKYFDKLRDCIIHNSDFREIIKKYDSLNSFFYLDPPYDTGKPPIQYYTAPFVTPEDVYSAMKNIQGKFLITYNDTPKIREIFKEYTIIEMNVLYQHNTNSKHRICREIIIMNF